MISAIRNRNLLMLWLSEATSQIGTRMYSLALAWWILNTETENSGMKMSILMICSFLPPILFGKFTGPRIDRARSLRGLLHRAYFAGFCVALALFVLFKLGYTFLPVFCLGAFAIACVQMFIDPSLQKAVPQVVPPAEIEKAVSLISTTTTLSSFAGALVGALVVASFGLLGCIAVNAGSFLLATLLLRQVKFNAAETEAKPEGSEQKLQSDANRPFDPFIRKLLIGFGFFNFFLTPVMVVLPIFVQRVLGNSAGKLGLLEGFLWAGFLAASVVAERIGKGQGPLRAGTALFYGLGLFLAAPALIQDAYLYGISLFGIGVTCGAANIKFITYFHQIIPETQKGRFFALLSAAAGIASPAAFLTAGMLLDHTSLEFFAIFQCLGCLAVATFFYSLSQKPLPKALTEEVQS